MAICCGVSPADDRKVMLRIHDSSLCFRLSLSSDKLFVVNRVVGVDDNENVFIDVAEVGDETSVDVIWAIESSTSAAPDSSWTCSFGSSEGR